ncbi:MAG: hypothetical protein IJA69_06210 [Clostridia bacterium]|nr:hypothetical protein [Clostridia bacterium]
MEKTSNKKNIHQGHRKRLRALIKKVGLENMSDINIVEYILTLCLPRKDTNALAHLLLDKFGSLRGVMEAESYELIEIPGIGKTTAETLPMFKNIAVAYYLEFTKTPNIIKNYNDIIDYIHPLFLGAKNEEIFVLYMKNENIIVKHEKVAEGDFKSVRFDFPELTKKIILSGCNRIIIAHNHPNGYAEPSFADIDLAESIRKKLLMYGIEVFDNVIVGPETFYSFKRRSSYKMREYLEEI